jgi:hypothetical protein
LPTQFDLAEAYPSPFNPATVLRFALPSPCKVSFVVYDILGRAVANLASGYFEAGYHSVTWDASSSASGVYFARFTALDAVGKVTFSRVNKLLLEK